ncbi:2-oxoglutarate oxidoreductase subunit KorB [bioreactor metagenome]|uniref:2-oxoglutarate oxidoreductase subunit KorB n=1 Tax=bioreactor metagenome TaxID=1076179 RepID=A0A644V5T5_9ZZZZ|nr:thiamine pyrophosphate-dependent enzyme [Acidaminococcaceae bacterium]
MKKESFSTYETAWCPGCGNFVILECLKEALEQLGKDPATVLMAAGIGQAAKTPQYISANAFCGLHGRALPAAVAAKIANENLTVIVDTGDGDSYGEGGNHFIHNIRRNVDITHFVHDNQVYGLTKGQASPTSMVGMVTGVQTDGNFNEPLNPMLLAIAAGAGFVARAFTGHKEQLIDIMKQAISYNGYAIVDILQPCVSFNKINTFGWYNKRVYELDESYDCENKAAAMEKTMEFGEKIPLGILYREKKLAYHQKNQVLKTAIPLLERKTDPNVVKKFIKSYI